MYLVKRNKKRKRNKGVSPSAKNVWLGGNCRCLIGTTSYFLFFLFLLT